MTHEKKSLEERMKDKGVKPGDIPPFQEPRPKYEDKYRKDALKPTKEELKELYVNHGKSAIQIGKELGISHVTVGRWLRKLMEYNQEIKNWDFSKENLKESLILLNERNLLIQEQTPLIDFHPEYDKISKNTSFTNSQKIDTLENIAFHVGYPHQERLYSLVSNQTNYQSNKGVFFSLDLKDVIYFSELNQKDLSMVYFLDTKNSKSIRIQTQYEKKVISRYDLDQLMKYEPTMPKKIFDKTHKKLNKKWIKENTIKFDIRKIEDLKKKGNEWLIVPDPINVQY